MECKPEKGSSFDVELKVNDKDIELNDFVRDFISETLIGMMKPLKGIDDGICTLSVSISRKA
jgi:hypothetical protein